MGRKETDGIWKIYECKCGKRFIPRPNWLYKIKSKYYCSYTCWRKDGGDGGNTKNKDVL